MGTISEFLAAFRRDRSQYERIEKDVEVLCKNALQGIDFLWQSRVKAAKSLEDKLRARNDKYKDESANVADACDLVAGRIILARWLDIEKVEKIVEGTFIIINRSQHPKPGRDIGNLQARFRGYDGLHFYVRQRGPSTMGFSKLVIEIQVMSPFMWGFTMLDHDIRYKELYGEPTEEILRSLELLKGIANLGEIAQQVFDNDLWLMTKESSQQSQQPGIGLALQATIQSVAAKVGFDEDDKQCLRDLRLRDPRDDKSRIEASKDQLLESLCLWVLEDPAFVKWWSQDDFQFLWLHGDPGKGKTMMMIALISEVSKRMSKRPGSNVLAYFFCQNTSSDLNTTVSVLRGLIYLLVDQEKKLIRHIRKSYDKAGRRLFEDENALYALQAVLKDILTDESLGNVYLMIDALDECDPTIHDLLRWIFSTSSQMSPKIKWLTTSRNQPGFQERLGGCHQLHTSLELNSMHIVEAVTIFINYKVKGLADLRSYSEELRLSVRDSLLEKAGNTFLWVALVCKELVDVRPGRVKSWLEKIPAGLTLLYERMLYEVLHQKDEYDIEVCRRILRAVILAFRPLRLDEIAVFAEALEDVHDLVGRCGSFITIREGIAYLVHQSAKDFLSNGQRNDIFHSGQEHGHAIMVRLCIDVMSKNLRKDICDLKMPGICHGDFDETRLDIHLPLPTQYACLYWVFHLQQAGPTEQETLVMSRDCRVYWALRRHFLHWLEALSLMRKVSDAVLALNSLCSTPSLQKNLELFSFVNDGRRFILESRHIIQSAPLQVYHSALIFSPKSSIVKRLFSHVLPDWVETLPVVEKGWTASLHVLEGHSDAVETIAFSPDGQLLASASYDHTVRLWESATGASRGTLEGHSSAVTALAFSPNGQLASASSDKTVRIWDPITKTLLGTLAGYQGWDKVMNISPNGQLLASASDDNSIDVWNPIEATSLRTFKGHLDSITVTAFSSDDQILASASHDNTIKLWDPVRGASLGTLKGHTDSIYALKFSPNGRLLASGSYDTTIRIWNPATKTSQRQLVGHSDYVTALAFSPNGQLLASASSDRTVKLWSSVGVLQSTLEDHSDTVTAVVFSPNGRLLASASYNHIRLWDPITGDSQGTLRGHLMHISEIAFSPNGQLLASASRDQTIRFWDLAIKTSQDTLNGHSALVTTIALSPSGQLLASASRDNTVKLWNSEGVLQGSFEGHRSFVDALAFSPNGQLLASVSAGHNISLWNVVAKACIILDGHTPLDNAVIFSPNGRLLASASLMNIQRSIRLWDSVTGECYGTLEGHTQGIEAMVFSPNGRLLASGDNRTIRLWNLVTKASQGTLEGFSSPIYKMVFSSDSQCLASIHCDDTIRIWSPKTKVLIQQMKYSSSQNLFIRHTESEPDVDQGMCTQFKYFRDSSLDFNHDGTRVAIDGRFLQISSSSPNSVREHGVADTSYLIDIKKEWVTYRGRRVLWLPCNRRPGEYLIRENTLVLGSGSGYVTLLRFSKTKTPF